MVGWFYAASIFAAGASLWLIFRVVQLTVIVDMLAGKVDELELSVEQLAGDTTTPAPRITRQSS